MMQRKRPHPVDVHVGGRIRMRRVLLSMSQEKLGDQLGLTFQQVQKYEKGSNRIGASRLWELSRILDVPISFFYEGAIDADAQDEGSGKPGQNEYVMNFVHSSEGLNMIRHFVKIEDANVRRSIVLMIKSLADSLSNTAK